MNAQIYASGIGNKPILQGSVNAVLKPLPFYLYQGQDYKHKEN